LARKAFGLVPGKCAKIIGFDECSSETWPNIYGRGYSIERIGIINRKASFFQGKSAFEVTLWLNLESRALGRWGLLATRRVNLL
jgi:hypothetical protein